MTCWLYAILSRAFWASGTVHPDVKRAELFEDTSSSVERPTQPPDVAEIACFAAEYASSGVAVGTVGVLQ